MLKKLIPILRILAALLVIALAWNLRWKAASNLPPDADEGIYLSAASQFADLVQLGDWAGFLQTNPNPEHPPLNKILFGWAILPTFEKDMIGDPNQAVLSPSGFNARRVSVAFGALTAGVLALVNPFAGFFLAAHTMTIKYSSEIMLEALPSFTSLLAVLCYVAYKRHNSPRNLWWIASAIFLGLTAAGKFLYALVGFAILLDWIISTPHTRQGWGFFLRTATLWGSFSLLAFLVANPYLWPDPIGRLTEALAYHSNYSSSAQEVVQSGFPIYQPFIWLVTSASDWHPQNVFMFSLDMFIVSMSIFGLVRLWKNERVFVLWLAVGLAFLLVWPTKWPQYILVLTAPLSLAAGEAVLILFKAIWSDLIGFRRGSL
ncbi:MAG: hypothetical protein CVU44_14135 [Chloroflexi bacterium HGW-Chloroflexi-6]|nr:MAG: hypothetical protein CVU44_14135 [Chloroflexi bacterium HGW-Chloroflexi-6]